MKGMDMVAGMLGINPDTIKQAQQFVEGMQKSFAEMAAAFNSINDKLAIISEQNVRIENNTIAILSSLDGTVPAAPTNYDVMPALAELPPMKNERVQHERSEHVG